jgi:hypothetical protein
VMMAWTFNLSAISFGDIVIWFGLITGSKVGVSMIPCPVSNLHTLASPSRSFNSNIAGKKEGDIFKLIERINYSSGSGRRPFARATRAKGQSRAAEGVAGGIRRRNLYLAFSRRGFATSKIGMSGENRDKNHHLAFFSSRAFTISVAISNRTTSASIPRLSLSVGRGVFSSDLSDARRAISYEKPRLPGRGLGKMHSQAISFLRKARCCSSYRLQLSFATETSDFSHLWSIPPAIAIPRPMASSVYIVNSVPSNGTSSENSK